MKINDVHYAVGLSHEVLPGKTVEQQEITLDGELLKCRECAMVKDARESTKGSTNSKKIETAGRSSWI